ncbi:MAG: acyltransferase [Lachnospiraceae bacterium]|nr:acyltransferase [Lachnospiraceae bacterium]
MQRSRSIDCLKGLLIIWVIILHFPFEIVEVRKYLFPFTVILAVPCFMMISGYVSSVAFENRKILKIEAAYNKAVVLKKIIRYTIPYTMAFIMEWIVFRIFNVFQVNIKTYGILAVTMDYIRGGYGQGSYYYPIMIQFIFVFPFIYFLIKKYQWKGLVYAFLLNAGYEILKCAYGMNDGFYRLLIFRYLFIIAAGCYFAMVKIQRNYRSIIIGVGSVVAGMGFIYLFSYATYSPKIITYWSSTSFVVCLFVIPILGWLLQKGRLACKPLEVVGKASFNIFLVQMIYYNFADSMYEMIEGRSAQLVFNIVNCVVAGVAFYYLEKPVTHFVINKCIPRTEFDHQQ